VSGETSKAARRELKKAFGPEIAEAIAELRALVQTVHNAQRVLARQMLDVERNAATLKEGRAYDQTKHLALGARVDELLERVEALGLRLEGGMKRLDRAEDVILALNRERERQAHLTRWERIRALFAKGDDDGF
jgi:hypothetical protein